MDYQIIVNINCTVLSGKCGNDGFYYNDGGSFVMCSNGNAYVQVMDILIHKCEFISIFSAMFKSSTSQVAKRGKRCLLVYSALRNENYLLSSVC